ncbi:MAG TPA: hypothetical protein VEW69_03575 [Alphaproteobacteria bacterium]|nr:hypothetical protein [Alphaproteobacteria bacterium]
MKFPRRVAVLSTLVLAFSGFTLAQQDASNPPADPPADAKEAQASVPLTAGQLPDQPQIQQLGRADFLTPNMSQFGVGPLHMTSLEIYQGIDGIGTDELRLIDTFRTNVLAQHSFGRSRLAVQYSPKLTLLDGQFLKNFSNQDSSLDTVFMLGSRASLTLGDHFQIFNTNNLDGDTFLSSDPISSNAVQQAFLEGPTPTRYMINSSQGTLNVRMTDRTSIAFTPSYAYSRASGLVVPIISHTYGGSLSLRRQMSSSQTLGLYYSYEAIRIENRDRPLTTPFDEMGISFSQQITSTWGVQSSFGAFKEGLPGGTRWSGSGHLSTSKSFGHSSIALAFFRGQSLAGVVTNNIYNRADALYRLPISRKLRIEVGSGYAMSRDINGLYVNSNFTWELRPNLTWFSGYTYKDQTGDQVQIATRTRGFVIFGIRIHPRSVTY